jgi:hypothetical protein
MFNKPTQTLADEIEIYTSSIKEQTALRDRAISNYRLLKDSYYLTEAQLYTQGIHTGQIVLNKKLQKVDKEVSK